MSQVLVFFKILFNLSALLLVVGSGQLRCLSSTPLLAVRAMHIHECPSMEICIISQHCLSSNVPLTCKSLRIHHCKHHRRSTHKLNDAQVHSYRNPVLFASAAKDIPSNALLVEIGPHSILKSPLRQCRPDLAYVSTMTRNKEAAQTLEDAVSEMWQSGVPVAWNAAPLPTNASGTERKPEAA